MTADTDGGLLLLGAREVEALLEGREEQVIEAVARAYRAHRRGASSLPHSTFLRFPNHAKNRIIALPAYLGDGFDRAGVKWIASFPENVSDGMPRASAVMVLNSCRTGRAEAILEGALISARRTAASAALAARELTRSAPPEAVGLVGTGPINFEVTRFLRATLPGLRRLAVFDLDAERAAVFARRAEALGDGLETEVAPSLESLLWELPLISFATSAVEPYVDSLAACQPGATILHVSLRDLSPEVILAADNVVDDPDHVCRASTSVHLAEQATGDRSFIRCTLADVLEGRTEPRQNLETTTIFSPFGLGILDLAVADRLVSLAREQGVGLYVPEFSATE